MDNNMNNRYENETPYYNPYTNPYTNPGQPPKPPKQPKKGGFGATVAKTIVAAIIFGIIAGGVFTGVSVAGNFVASKFISSDDKNSGNGKNDSAKDNATADKTTGKDNSKADKPAVQQTTTGQARELTDVSAIVTEVMPSIVAITNTSTINYRDFWGGVESREAESAGSGIIIEQDNDYLYIATNNHVVAGADTLKVQFSDSNVVEAELQGTVPSSDLAVVKVAIDDIDSDTYEIIKVAKIGDSDALLVGEPSIAIGNALGYGQSVTTGIVSALGRSITTRDESTGNVITNNNLIQTDAAINPGNSGGALLNSKGEVIGINSVKYASTEVEGIGYAIAMADAMPILEKLIETGSYTNSQTAYLGIQGGDVSADMTAFNFPAGVYVAAVIPGSGADKAGLQEGDIITAINGTEISGMSELQFYLQGYNAGDEVTVSVARQKGKGYVTGDIKIILSARSDIE